MKYQKKSQLVVLASLLLLFSLVFIYSLETENYYIKKKSDISILENINSQVCKMAYDSNSSNLIQRFNDMEIDIENFCLDLEGFCDLNISLKTGMPPAGNFSLLNHTQYNYMINFSLNQIRFQGDLKC
jgi:hypothetical protein